ncbi:ATP-binding cassette domain-containing protein (plasmid) [Streptomyces sp. CA-294286]|uniref:ATP-binding cassette domain-containing protein n=1 Tax=Streptomyces sp. CA-294286 TaxID=3240070 RepID=UPI003D8E8F63
MTQMPSTRQCLRLDDVWKAYGRRQVLSGADLCVRAGTLVAVVGENGAGKSTLLRIAVGQVAADRGGVERVGPFGYCPQVAVLNDTLTVRQHLRLFQVAYGLHDLRRAHELMHFFGFEDCENARVASLSGGTRQKLNLTLALMHDPQLLVLDEPYQGFDWDTHRRFWELASILRAAGRSVLVVTHLVHEQEQFDAVRHLHRGRFLQEASST